MKQGVSEAVKLNLGLKLNIFCTSVFCTSVAVSYPVLMEMISMRGFFLILGKSSLAPPSLRPPSFFWLNRRTEWPENNKHTVIMFQLFLN